MGKALDEHERPDLLRRARGVLLAVQQALDVASMRARAAVRFDATASSSSSLDASSSASRHSICSIRNCGRHGRVAFGVDGRAAQLAQVGGAASGSFRRW
jgi:hypothetical protein